jgi:hypothetical protein
MSCFFLAYKQDRWRLTLKLNSFLAMPFNVRLNRELKYNPALTSQIKMGSSNIYRRDHSYLQDRM